MQFAGRFAPWKVASHAENLVLQALQFKKMMSAAVLRRDSPCNWLLMLLETILLTECKRSHSFMDPEEWKDFISSKGFREKSKIDRTVFLKTIFFLVD
jgi:hypothetical protein